MDIFYLFLFKNPIMNQDYMKKNKKETKIYYIIPQHRAHLLQLSEKYTENDNSPKIEVKTKEKQRTFDQTLVYFRALSNP